MRILFVCTGNVFRSYAAERICKHFLEGLPHKVSSAGTNMDPKWYIPEAFEAIETIGMDGDNHYPRQLTKELVEESDIIVGMDQTHVDYIKDVFQAEAHLFYDAAWNRNFDVLDDDEIIRRELWDSQHDAYVLTVVLAIFGSMQKLIKRLHIT